MTHAKNVLCRFTFLFILFFLCIQDSLAAEIEGTMRKELQMDDPDVEEQKYVLLALYKKNSFVFGKFGKFSAWMGLVFQ